MSRLAAAFVLLLAAAAALLLGAVSPAPLQRFWLDLQLRASADTQAPAGVIVIDVDEASLAALRSQGLGWPLPRDVYALLVEALRDAGARAIVIDLVLDEARAGDAALARSVARGGAPVFLAAAGVPGPRTAARALPSWQALTLPHPGLGLKAQSSRLGLVSQILDADGRLRHWQLWHDTPEGRLALMPVAVLRELGLFNADPDAQGQASWVLRLGAVPPQRSLAPLLEAVRDGRHEALAEMHGQIVFLGASASLSDRLLTPWGQRQGTAVLAGATAALRDGQWLERLPPLALLPLGALGLLPVLALLLRGGQARAASALGWSGVSLGLLALAIVLLTQGGWQFDPGPALLALGLCLAGELMLLLVQQRWEAQRLRHAEQLALGARQARVSLLGAVSDELRTPLSAVLGLAELLQQEAGEGALGRRARLLTRAAERLGALVDDLLDFNRLELGAAPPAQRPFELAAVLRDAVGLAQARRGHERVLVDVRQAPELMGWRLGDAQRLVQVLAALLTNALAFTPVGRVLVQVQRGRDDDHLLFSVSDTGIGIAPSQLTRLFELQADDTTAAVLRQGGGALALAAARQRVRQLGGDIEAASVPGAGSRFSFELALPACDAAAETQNAAQALDGRHLLLAEDDELAAEVLAAQLESLGLGVEKAGNGQLAAALALRLPFDWLLVDRQLAGLDGLAVVRRLREHERTNAVPRTPVLLLVADDTEALRRDALQAGVDDLLVKPVSQAQLRAVLLRTAAAQRAAMRPRPAAPLGPVGAPPEPSGSEAHALRFLGLWSGRWAQADAHQRRALRDDLRSCAQRLGDSALAAAADAGDAAALDAAVEATLMRLRGLAP